VSISQNHGLLVQGFLAPKFGNKNNFYGEGFDYAKHPITGLPVALKCQKAGTICVSLSSAINFMESARPSHLLVCEFEQINDQKVFRTTHEFTFRAAHVALLHGDLTLDDVRWFDREIKKRMAVANRDYTAIRNWAKKHAAEVSTGLLRLNPKIDGENRRVQCSLRMADIQKDTFEYHRSENGYLNYPLPSFNHTPREFSKKSHYQNEIYAGTGPVLHVA
jgi:hypothetical protein